MFLPLGLDPKPEQHGLFLQATTRVLENEFISFYRNKMTLKKFYQYESQDHACPKNVALNPVTCFAYLTCRVSILGESSSNGKYWNF